MHSLNPEDLAKGVKERVEFSFPGDVIQGVKKLAEADPQIKLQHPLLSEAVFLMVKSVENVLETDEDLTSQFQDREAAEAAELRDLRRETQV